MNTTQMSDVVAMDCVPLLPRGLGVRQPYAAFVLFVLERCSVPWLHAALWSYRSPYVGCHDRYEISTWAVRFLPGARWSGTFV
jgi:hypothetical protein